MMKDVRELERGLVLIDRMKKRIKLYDHIISGRVGASAESADDVDHFHDSLNVDADRFGDYAKFIDDKLDDLFGLIYTP